MKTIIATVGAALTALTLGAQEAGEKAAELEAEEEEPVFEAGFDLDFFSAYVWRNAVQTDDMVMQPCVWADYTQFDPFTVGFFIWQNYDLTDKRGDVYRRGLNETDYDVYIGWTPYTSDDESMSLELAIGHEWAISQFPIAAEREYYPSTREIFFKVKFANPVVDVYGQASWMYQDFGAYKQSMYYELGFNKEVELVTDTLTLGADWNIDFGDSRFLYYLHGGLPNPYQEVGEDGAVEEVDDFDRGPEGGIGGTTLKFYLSWAIADWVSLKGTLAYTGLLNGDIRQAHGECDDDSRDLLWGGLSLNFAF